MKMIAGFEGNYSYLSHTYRSPGDLFEFENTGVRARSVEAEYMARRLLRAGEVAGALAVLREPTGVKAKMRHNELVNAGAETERSLRARLALMLALDLAKFVRNPRLAERLKATEGALLIEYDPAEDGYKDPTWGMTRLPDPETGDPGEGANLAGRSAMWVREVISDANFVPPSDEELQANVDNLRFMSVADRMLAETGLAV